MAEGFEADGGEALEGLVAGVDFDAHGFQGRDSQNWLGVGFAENYCGSDEFAHELDASDGDAHTYFAAVGQLVNAIPFRLHSDGLQMLSGHHAIRCAGVDQEKPFPNLVMVGRVAYGGGYVYCSHLRVPFCGLVG